jgi:hypothetical protein
MLLLGDALFSSFLMLMTKDCACTKYARLGVNLKNTNVYEFSMYSVFIMGLFLIFLILSLLKM